MIVVHDGKRMSWRCGSRFAYGDCGQCQGCRVPDDKIEQIVTEYLRRTKNDLRKDEHLDQHDYDFDIEQMKVRCSAMRFDQPNDTEIARLDAYDEEHRGAIKDLTEKIKRLTSTAGIEILDQAIKEHERAILDNKWKREELQEQLTPEEMASRIEEAEKAKAESKARAYNEFLKTIIDKICVFTEAHPPQKGRSNRRYSLRRTLIVPVNALEIAGVMPIWHSDPREDGIDVQAHFIQPPEDKDTGGPESLTYNQAGEVCPVFKARMAGQGT